jgi:hypothetical protein
MSYRLCWLLASGIRVDPVDFYSKNKFEKLVHLIGFIIRIYHDARYSKCQNIGSIVNWCWKLLLLLTVISHTLVWFSSWCVSSSWSSTPYFQYKFLSLNLAADPFSTAVFKSTKSWILRAIKVLILPAFVQKWSLQVTSAFYCSPFSTDIQGTSDRCTRASFFAEQKTCI